MKKIINMHRLLKRQLKRNFGNDVNIESLDQSMQNFLQIVSNTYYEFEKERNFIEDVLEYSAQEIYDANKIINEKNKKLKDINDNLEKQVNMEVEKSKRIEKQLFQTDKLVSMGEMIGNIAHQWRQPLSIVSTASTGMKLQKELNVLTDKELLDNCDIINNQVQYLSKTIDDFRNFIMGDREKEQFNLKDTIHSFLTLVEGSVKSANIEIILNFEDEIFINGYQNELTQCLINIFNNAKDALKENMPNGERFVFINIKKVNSDTIISIKDNAKGIPPKIISRIFEPYFTTKHQTQGTGLGLHMAYNLVVDGMKGSIVAKNICYEYNKNKYIGAEFIITIPIS
jgi:signal transduction histidine kinase